jgi:hypothetical protein
MKEKNIDLIYALNFPGNKTILILNVEENILKNTPSSGPFRINLKNYVT